MLNRKNFRIEWKSALWFVLLVTLLPLATALDIRTQLGETLLTIAINSVLFVLAVIFLCRENIRWADIGMHIKSWRTSLFFFVGWWLAVTLVDLTGRWLAGQIDSPILPAEVLNWNFVTLLDFLSAWVFVGFAEELAFRGYLHNKLVAITNKKWLGMGLAALLFGLWHIPGSMVMRGTSLFEALPGALFLGLFSLIFLNLPYEWTGLLPFISLFHAWSDFPLLMNFQYPSAIGAIAGYVLLLVVVALKVWLDRRVTPAA
ncbi:MAG: CPBP family intramembrane metalloprotease [Anaerolineales bacterium]|jgi:membrane protease YdiL (CAAX protease family)